MTEDLMQCVENLIRKAASMDAHNAPAAVNFSQAACNAANAIRVLEETRASFKK